MNIIGKVVGALFEAVVGGVVNWLRETRTEKNLQRLGWQQAQLDAAGVSRSARQKQRERKRDVLRLTMEQIIDINRRGAAVLDGVRDADVEDGDKPAVPVVGREA